MKNIKSFIVLICLFNLFVVTQIFADMFEDAKENRKKILEEFRLHQQAQQEKWKKDSQKAEEERKKKEAEQEKQRQKEEAEIKAKKEEALKILRSKNTNNGVVFLADKTEKETKNEKDNDTKKFGLCGVYLGEKDPNSNSMIEFVKQNKYPKERELKGIAANCYMGYSVGGGKKKVPHEDFYNEYKRTGIKKPFRNFDSVRYISSPIDEIIHTITVSEGFQHQGNYKEAFERCMSDDEIKTALDEFDIVNNILEKHYKVKGVKENINGLPKSYHLDDSNDSKEQFTRITYKINSNVTLYLEQFIYKFGKPCYARCKNRKNYSSVCYWITMVDSNLHKKAKEERLQIEKAIQEIERESNDGTVGLD